MQLGVMPTYEALSLARDRGVDLIEISPGSAPPVCRLDDYGRLRYEQNKKDREARKKAHTMELKEVKLRPKIEEHDYQVKIRTAERLLFDGDKVKVTIMFRGREIAYSQHGRRILDRVAQDMAKLASVEREPRIEGRNMFMILSPRQDAIAAMRRAAVRPAAVRPQVDAGPSAGRTNNDSPNAVVRPAVVRPQVDDGPSAVVRPQVDDGPSAVVRPQVDDGPSAVVRPQVDDGPTEGRTPKE